MLNPRVRVRVRVIAGLGLGLGFLGLRYVEPWEWRTLGMVNRNYI